MRRLDVLCDADDTIENLLDCWVSWLNDAHNINVATSDIKSWDIAEWFPMLTKAEVFEPIYNNDLWKMLQPIPGSVDGLREINTDHNLYIVTATNHNTCSAKVERILEIFPFLSWEQFIISSYKQIINGHILIDDGVHNLINGHYHKILFTRPHNESFDAEGNGMKRVFVWPEITQEVRKVAMER